MILKLPFTNDPAQNVTVQLGPVKYDLFIRWNDRAATWCLDVTDHATQTNLVRGIPLLLGQDLLAPYPLDIGNLVVNDEDNTGRDAGPDDLGTRINLYWYSDGANS